MGLMAVVILVPLLSFMTYWRAQPVNAARQMRKSNASLFIINELETPTAFSAFNAKIIGGGFRTGKRFEAIV